MYFVEEAEITGNGFSKLAVGGGGERDAAPAGFFLLKKIKNLLSIGKTGGVEVDPRGELAFEGGSSRKQPEGEQQECDRAGFEEGEDALPKHITPDQSAVEIDTQDRGKYFGGFGSCDRPHGMIVA